MVITTIEHSVSFLASIGAFVSAIAALMTIRTMKKQIRDSYLPELFISADHSNRIIVQQDLDTEIRNIACYFDFGGVGEAHGLRVILNNVGLGAAKNISIKWRFDYEKALEKINNWIEDPIKLVYTSDRNGLFVMDSDDSYLYFIDLVDNGTRLDYVLPLKDAPFEKFPVVPTYITGLHIIHFLCKNSLLHTNNNKEIHEHLRPVDLFENFPVVEVQISYEDIGGNRFEKFFNVKPYISLRNVNDDDLEYTSIEGLHLNFFMSFSNK